MLKFMTKETFIQGVKERRFIISNPKGSTFEVHYIGISSDGNGTPQYNVSRVTNPNSKDGTWRKTGGGYNKEYATLEDIALYIDEHAEDKDEGNLSARKFLMTCQRYNSI
jgi:hypothetical protein